MKTFRYGATALLLAAAGTALPAGQRQTPSWYADQFGEQEARVARSTSTRDDAEFAAKMLASARELDAQPKAKALLCEKACEFGLKDAAGWATAVEALALLRTCTEGREAEIDARLLEASEVRYKLSRGPERERAGLRLVAMLVEAGEKALAAGQGDRAVTSYARAVRVASAIRLPQARSIAMRRRLATEAARTVKEAEDLEKARRAAPDNRALATRLLMLYLVERDDPAKAVELLRSAEASEAVRTYAPLAAKGPAAANEALSAELGDWYAALAAKARGYGKYRMLRRSRAYYQRFLALHEKKDVTRLRVAMAMAKVVKALEPLMPPRIPVELLALTDVRRDAVTGQWREGPDGLQATTDTCALLALRGPEAASYELTVRFTRTSGKDTVCVTIPVGRRRCCLVLDSWNGKASGLEYIDGKEATENPTTVRRKVVVNGKQNTVRLAVRALPEGDADIVVDLNGKRLVSWRGRPAVLGIGHPEYAPRRRDAFGLAFKKGNVTFHSARLVALP